MERNTEEKLLIVSPLPCTSVAVVGTGEREAGGGEAGGGEGGGVSGDAGFGGSLYRKSVGKLLEDKEKIHYLKKGCYEALGRQRKDA